MCARGKPTNVSLGLMLCIGLAHAQQPSSAQDSVPTFGTTVIVSSGLRGEIYLLPTDTAWLPNFKHLKPIGAIYTTSLNVPPSDFQQGFPGITSRYEWFAIDYTGKLWIEQAAQYRFGLVSDDGSKLYLDGRLMIDNDGIHPSSSCTAVVELGRGVHSLRVSYFQGPRYQVSLMLGVAKSGEPWRIFDTRNFTPPSDSAMWSSKQDQPGKSQVRKIKGGNCGTS